MSNLSICATLILLAILVTGIPHSKNLHKPAIYTHIRLSSDHVNAGKLDGTILIECPIEALAASSMIVVRRSKKPLTTQRHNVSAILTSWFKDNTKLNQFNIDEGGRVKLFHRVLKIKNMRTSDSGVYSCGILSGSGITVRSHTLVLNVIGN